MPYILMRANYSRGENRNVARWHMGQNKKQFGGR